VPTAYINWIREDHRILNPGHTFPSAAEAAQAVADMVARVRRTTDSGPGSLASKTYDHVAVTVP
jgi:kynureninase